MKNKTHYILTLIIIASCYFISTAAVEKKENTLNIPEGYVALNDSVYISKYEVSNGLYKSFTQNNENNSKYFHPDSTCILFFAPTPNYGDPYRIKFMYFKHPAYNIYPVVGISYEQAIDFCQLLNDSLSKNTTHKFIYRLPTLSEWKQALGNKNIGLPSKEYRKSILEFFKLKKAKSKEQWSNIIVSDYSIFIKKDSSYVFVKKEITDYGCSYEPPIQEPYNIVSSVPNENNLHHLIGNVSEMVAEKGIAKGLNFAIPYNENFRDTLIQYTGPEPWLGFRMVYEIKKPTIQ